MFGWFLKAAIVVGVVGTLGIATCTGLFLSEILTKETWIVTVPGGAAPAAPAIREVLRQRAAAFSGWEPEVVEIASHSYRVVLRGKTQSPAATPSALSEPGAFLARTSADGAVVFDETDVEEGHLGFDAEGKPIVLLLLGPEAGERMRLFTSSHQGESIDFTLDGSPVASAQVSAPVTRHLQLSLSRSAVEAHALAAILDGGRLPVGAHARLE